MIVTLAVVLPVKEVATGVIVTLAVAVAATIRAIRVVRASVGPLAVSLPVLVVVVKHVRTLATRHVRNLAKEAVKIHVVAHAQLLVQTLAIMTVMVVLVAALVPVQEAALIHA